MTRFCAALILVSLTSGAIAEVQERARYSLQGQKEATAPKMLRDQTGKSPDLVSHGSPKVSTDAPESRRKQIHSSLQFDEPGQCYNVAKHLIVGDNFVLEVWVRAATGKEEGWHAVVANGTGANGLLIARHDDQWKVLVGGVGAVSLGEVDEDRWTHLAVVKSRGVATGWLNGKCVCDVPKLSVGAENFSLGATSPGREAFRGNIAEVRYSTFQPGKFDPRCDFLGNPQPYVRPFVEEGPEPSAAAHSLKTQYAAFGFDDKGYLLSISSRQSNKQYCPGRHPSPVLSLHESGQPNEKLLTPVSAIFDSDKQEIRMKYSNGTTAVVKAEARDGYLRFQLLSLAPRETVDNIVWGPIKTKIAGKIGDLLGVVHDKDWAIGLYGLDDNTISGPVTDGDCYSMGYFAHSPDQLEHPLPRKYKEGQWMNIGGDGVNDVAFFSRPEEYFQYVCGNGAKVEPEFGSSIAYHARDRRRTYSYHWSLLAGFERFRARRMVSDPLSGVDFIGSSVALYACPEELGLEVLEKITLSEKLPYITDRDGKWIRDPASYRATVYWNGAVDKAIEYTKALGLKDISRDTGSFYPSLNNKWVGQVGLKNGKVLTYKEFSDLAHKEGVTHGGLHTLCVFLQGGISTHVSPAPSERLQTICRTKLAKDISETDLEIVVTDPSFLAEKGTWGVGDDSNYLRIGGEMLRYEGISDSAPWTIKVAQRGHGSKAVAHKAGDELVKLHQNVYNGFLPDMTLLPEYADYYAELMHRNGMDTIDFDGFESLVGLNHGYYGVRVFCRRLFETYQKLTGKWPRVTTSNVFPGSWEYLNVCNIGGGSHMFDPVTGRRAIQGKDIGNGWSNSWYPATFGKQDWNSAWSLYDAENLEAKAVGWDATYALLMSEDGIDRTGERDNIFQAFRAWQNARASKIFTKAQKLKLRDPALKFHLEQKGQNSFDLYPVEELRLSGHSVEVFNEHGSQPLQFALRLFEPTETCVIALPDGAQIKSERRIEKGHYIICKGSEAYVANELRKRVADLTLTRSAVLPAGESKIGVELAVQSARANWTVWIFGDKEGISR